jgi:anti-anti-sigma regulatory factor
MASTCEISGKNALVKLDGDLTVNHAAEIRKIMMHALTDADQALIDFGNVTNADLSSLQLLCSAHKTAASMNKHLLCAGRLPDALRKAAEEAGYARFAGCRLECAKNCLWAAK